MDKLKTWLVEVAIRKIGPSAMASLIASGVALAAAHQGLLESWGITVGMWPLVWPAGQEPSGQVILVELGTVSSMALAGLGALVVSLVMAGQHHATAVVTGAPQSGDLRKSITSPVNGGDRKDDPPMAV